MEQGQPGEIVVRGHSVMKGYYNRPEATAEAMRGGWFHTGDIASMDKDGYFFIVDRKKDMIIRGGYNVYPRELEEVLDDPSRRSRWRRYSACRIPCSVKKSRPTSSASRT